eukprot:671061-Amphidinium_carterae.1
MRFSAPFASHIDGGLLKTKSHFVACVLVSLELRPPVHRVFNVPYFSCPPKTGAANRRDSLRQIFQIQFALVKPRELWAS